MKKHFCIILLILLSTALFAQQDSTANQVETLLSGKIESGGYGGPLIKLGQILGKTGFFVGGQGGWIINHRFVLGGKGYVLVNPVEIEGLQNIHVGFGCGGVLLKYICNSDKLVHVTFESMIGLGGVYNDVTDYSKDHDPIDYTGDAGLVLEPGINIELNVAKHFRINAGITYLFVNGIEYDPGAPYQDVIGTDYSHVSDSDLGGMSVLLSFEFGVF
jgi:hypothetical protein